MTHKWSVENDARRTKKKRDTYYIFHAWIYKMPVNLHWQKEMHGFAGGEGVEQGDGDVIKRVLGLTGMCFYCLGKSFCVSKLSKFTHVKYVQLTVVSDISVYLLFPKV